MSIQVNKLATKEENNSNDAPLGGQNLINNVPQQDGLFVNQPVGAGMMEQANQQADNIQVNQQINQIGNQIGNGHEIDDREFKNLMVSFPIQAETFISEEDKGRSPEFLEVKRTLLAIRDDELQKQIREGNLNIESEKYEMFLRLNEALTTYIRAHENAHLPAGRRRLRAAVQMREMLTMAAKMTLMRNDVNTGQEPLGAVSREKRALADKIVDKMHTHYSAYCEQIEGDMISSYEEKLRGRWNVLKTCENDIRIMIESHDERNPLTKEQTFIKNEYESLRNQIMLIELSKNRGGVAVRRNKMSKTIRDHAFDVMGKQQRQEASGLGNENEGLEEKQLEGLQKIDAWVIRNIRNGGYMTLGRNKTDRTDFASKLLSLSKRERLYIYYLVESRERVKPTAEGLAKAQVTYVPDLSTFKGHMIATKAKFYTRFSGGYVYWNKLAEAMEICNQARPAMQVLKESLIGRDDEEFDDEEIDDEEIEEIEGEGIKVQKLEDGDDDDEDEDEDIKVQENKLDRLSVQREAGLKKLMKNLIESMKLTNENDKKETSAERKAEIEKRLLILKAQRVTQANRIQNLQKKIGKITGVDKHVKDKVDTAMKFGGEVNGTASKILNLSHRIALESMGTTELVNDLVQKCSVGTWSGMGALCGLVGIASALMALIKNHASMTNWDVVASVGGMALGVGQVASFGTTVAAMNIDSATLAFTATVGMAVGVSAVGAAVGVVKTVSYLTNGYRRKKASQLAAQEKNPDKFRDGMVKLNRRLGVKQRISTLANTGTACATVAATALVAASVLMPIFGIVAGGVALAVGIGTKYTDNSYMKKMRGEMNDAFFDTDHLTKQVEEEWKENHPGMVLDESRRAKLKKQVMRRMAGELGYYSPNHMAVAVSKRFATYLYNGSREEGNHGEMCRAMIRGLGLYYKQDPNDDENSVPTISDIAMKLCG